MGSTEKRRNSKTISQSKRMVDTARMIANPTLMFEMYAGAAKIIVVATVFLHSYTVHAIPHFQRLRRENGASSGVGTAFGSSASASVFPYYNSTLAQNGTQLVTATTGPATTSTAYQGAQSTPSSNQKAQNQQSRGVLFPAVHWSQPVQDLKNLEPSQQQTFYYTPGGACSHNEEHTFAQVSTNTSHPSVVCSHSERIQVSSCHDKNIVVSCSDQDTVDRIVSTWPTDSPFIFITFEDGCGKSSDQHTFWLAKGVEVDYEAKSISVTVVQELSIAEAMPEVEVSWGIYSPSQGGTPKTNPPTPPYPVNGNHTSGFNSTSGLNDTASGSANSSCGAPPSLMIDGFYTATCGSPTFDADIDAEIGFLEFDSNDYSSSLENFAPNTDDDYSQSDNADQGFNVEQSRRMVRLRRRGWLDGAKNLWNKGKQFVSNLGAAAVDLGKQAIQGISDALTIAPTASANLPINVALSNLVDSPWGPAKQLFKKEKDSKGGAVSGSVTLYCVDCGVQGTVLVLGRLRYSILAGLTQAEASLNGNIAAGLQIGIDAEAEFKQEYRYPLYSQGIPVPPLSVSGIYSIGPVVTLDAEIDIGVTLAGQVLAGAKVTIPNFAANLDLVDNSKSSTSGFTPQVEKVFQAKGTITATAGIGLPIGVGLGIDIPAIKFRKTAAVYEKPSIEATAKYLGSTTGEGIGGDTTCVNGVSYQISFKNNLYADFFGLKKIDIDQRTVPLTGDCIPVGAPTNTGGTDQPPADPASPAPNDPETPADNPDPTPPETGDVGGNTKRAITKRGDEPFDFVDGDDDDLPADNEPFDSLSDLALNEADQDLTTTGNTTNEIPDETYVYINDASATYGLEIDPLNGNIYLTSGNGGSLFAATSGYAIGDAEGRFLHYYPDLMQKYGVSRFRVSSEIAIPKDADFVGLVPIPLDDNKPGDIYAALDTSGNAFLTITCDFEGEGQNTSFSYHLNGFARSGGSGPPAFACEFSSLSPFTNCVASSADVKHVAANQLATVEFSLVEQVDVHPNNEPCEQKQFLDSEVQP
ncbi:uncharacterized protein KY384_005756 [Bacidia gigantensis]|uniref:uncharacterized protein n=1 Tax=Bacidia gigantensis TaxID=2732470 RepID=UPI001D05554D|nr:uncharacterized protein KY384_005756 [Bacidia gigantensis]KAG8529121.1 hypothetical protein KY384_005756 [Bacidia gigantensis]